MARSQQKADGYASPRPAPSGVHGPHWGAPAWGLVLSVSGALFLDGIDLSMVNIALPSMASELNLQTAAMQWIVNAYILGYGGFLLLGGRASDLLGRRAVFLTAVAVFGIASTFSALLNDGFALIAMRFVKGVAAGFTVPSALSIIVTAFEKGPARSKALTIYSIFGSLGFASGLVLGGLFTEFGWRITLLAPGPISLVLFVVAYRLVPQANRNPIKFEHFDLLGALCMTGALLLLVYALVSAPERGWTGTSTWMMLLLSVALITVFVFVEKRHEHPLVRLGILRSARLMHSNMSAAVILGSFMGFQFIVTLYLQMAQGWSPMKVAMAFMPSSVPVALLANRISRTFAAKPSSVPIMIGLCLSLAGYLWLLQLDPHQSYWVGLFPVMLLTGLGFAFTLPAIYVQGVQGVEDSEQGLASGLLNTSFQIGGAVSLALVAAILSSAHSPVESGILLPRMFAASCAVAAIAALGVTISLPWILRTSHLRKSKANYD